MMQQIVDGFARRQHCKKTLHFHLSQPSLQVLRLGGEFTPLERNLPQGFFTMAQTIRYGRLLVAQFSMVPLAVQPGMCILLQWY